MKSEHETMRRLLDEHFARGLPPQAEAELRAHLPDCVTCRSAYEAYQVAERLDPNAIGARERLGLALGLSVESRRRTRSRSPWALGVLAVAGAAVLMLAVAAPFKPMRPAMVPRGAPIARTEGLEVAIFRLQGGRESTPVEHAISASDELAFAYRNELGKPYLMIFAVDGDRRVVWYHPGWTNPADNPKAVPITTQVGFKELPEAIRHPLRGPRLSLYSLFMDEPLDVRTVEARIAAGAPIADIQAGETLHEVELEVQP